MSNMASVDPSSLVFENQTVSAQFIDPSGNIAAHQIEIRTHPITGRTCRISFSRIEEKEPATGSMPQPPPDADQTDTCPFCRPQVHSHTPRLHPDLAPAGRLTRGDSILFPNLFPYGSYSAVSLFDNAHFVEIGKATVASYANSFMNCSQYLAHIRQYDPEAVYMAITQNHLPSAGGSLIHPHLQINADRLAANYQRALLKRANDFFQNSGNYLFASYLDHEIADGSRQIGTTGAWEWLAAFAPEGFYEIWGILPYKTSFQQLSESDWQDLARGILRVQRFYRQLCRNGYNLGILAVEMPSSRLELRIVIMVRSNYAPWVRSDHTGFEMMLGDMTTFNAPEQTAEQARPFF
jgi:galactose-1-phosphate uridylyltransferase